jgi:hypothetical protein
MNKAFKPISKKRFYKKKLIVDDFNHYMKEAWKGSAHSVINEIRNINTTLN